jgi:hypothetical protein
MINEEKDLLTVLHEFIGSCTQEYMFPLAESYEIMTDSENELLSSLQMYKDPAHSIISLVLVELDWYSCYDLRSGFITSSQACSYISLRQR